MNYLDALIAALDALRMHKLRSALTMLGIIVGVASLIAMVAVGGGARERVLDQIRSMGTNMLIAWPGSVTRSGVRLGAGAAVTMHHGDAVAIAREIPAVQATALVVSAQAQFVSANANWMASLRGADSDYFLAREWNVDQGRLFDPDEATRGTQVALIGQTAARKLFGDRDPMGEEIRVGTVPLRIIGTLAPKGQSTWGSDQDDVVFVPLATARQRIFGLNPNPAIWSAIYIKVRDGEDMVETQRAVSELLRERHRLEPQQPADFGLGSVASAVAAREASAHTLSQMLIAIAAISLAVGGIGIMNIMLVSVTERTREIGIRLTVGARRRDILRQFLLEALGISAIGGAVGVLLGIAAAYAIANSIGWPLLIRPESILLAVLFSALVGIFFGWYPAFRASRLDPIEALRHA